MDLFLRILGLIIRVTATLVANLLRQFLRLLLHLATIIFRWMFNLIAMAFVASVNGPRQYIERRAAEWTSRLLAHGMSRDHLDIAHHTSRIIITCMIVLGWMGTGFFMVTIGVIFVVVFRVVFG